MLGEHTWHNSRLDGYSSSTKHDIFCGGNLFRHGIGTDIHLAMQQVLRNIALLHVLLPFQLVILLRLLQEGFLEGAGIDPKTGEHAHQVLHQLLVN